MDCYKTLILLFFGYRLNSCSQFPPRTYYVIDMKMTWDDAQRFCRENYTDLATFKNMDDINSFKTTVTYEWAWIGLRDDPQAWKYAMGNESNSWRWSATGETSKTGYSNWETNEPQNAGGSETCALMAPYGKWNDLDCGAGYYFICYTVTNENKRTYVLIRNTAPWDTAQKYCREHHTDLAMIESAEENNEVIAARSDAQRVWIGLYRVPWTWPDKSRSSFANWEYNRPNNNHGIQFCVLENNQHEWKDEACHLKYPFVCHQVSRLRKMVRVEFHTDADISNPAVSAQLLQKLSAALADQGWTEVSLKWRIQPKKPAEDGAESKEAGGKPNGKGPPGRPNKN